MTFIATFVPFSFTITASDDHTHARCATLATPHGDIETPAFIFCATKAAIRTATPQVLREEQTQIILGNTYHLTLQPGEDIVANQGGLQEFTGWRGPMLTDSGGFQIFSLGHGGVANEIKGRGMAKTNKTLLNITEEGAEFRSYVDGEKRFLSPETSIDIQHKLGADLILVLDECTPFHVDKAYTAKSMNLSHRWALRSLQRYNELENCHQIKRQQLYGIVQGGIHEDLRQASASFVAEQPFFGQAVGGTLGQHSTQMDDVVAFTMQHLRRDRPTHLLGIGGLRDIWAGVEQGIDTFDCVHPTRLARHGSALYPNKTERLNLANAPFRHDNNPILEELPVLYLPKP